MGRFIPSWILMAHRGDPLLFWCITAFSFAAVVPFWVGEFLPFLDIPQHLATIGVIHSFDDSSFGFESYFTLDLGSTQYLLYYLMCDWLAVPFGVETANRIFISLYALALPLSVLCYLHVYDRTRAVALLAIPLTFNKFLFFGFINYVFAFPLMFFGLALQKRSIDQKTTCWRTEVALVVCGLLLFYSHLQIFLVYFGGCGLTVLMHWPGRRRFFVRLLHLAPVLLLLLVWLVRSPDLASGSAWDSAVSARYASLTGADWEPLQRTLQQIPDRLMSVYTGGEDELITVIFVAFLLGLLVMRNASGSSKKEGVGRFAPEVLSLFVVAFYFVTPTSYKWVWPINWRFVPLAALLLLSWSTWKPAGWSRRILTAVLAGFIVWTLSVHAKQFAAFNAEAQEIRPVLAEIEPQSRLMSLVFDSGSGVINGPAYLHFGQYHQLRKGGVAVYSFAEAPQSPIRFRPQEFGGPPPTALRSEWKPHDFRFQRDGRFYNYYLVRGERAGFFHRAGFKRSEVKKVVTSGRWTLYKNVSR